MSLVHHSPPTPVALFAIRLAGIEVALAVWRSTDSLRADLRARLSS